MDETAHGKRADSLAADHYGKNLPEQVENIRDKVKSLVGPLFSPELVELFFEVSDADAFEDALQLADEVMCRVKNSGKNGILLCRYEHGQLTEQQEPREAAEVADA